MSKNMKRLLLYAITYREDDHWHPYYADGARSIAALEAGGFVETRETHAGPGASWITWYRLVTTC